MRRAIICGLYQPDYTPEAVDALASLPGDIWTLNDWYITTVLPREPVQIWNIHRFPHVNPDPRRFLDWKRRYNEAQARGARIIGLEPMRGVNGVELLDTARLERESYLSLGCSISAMITQAVLDGFDAIELFGVKLTDREYEFEVYGVLKALDFARSRGAVAIVHPAGREHGWRSRLTVVDWANIQEAYKPYWRA